MDAESGGGRTRPQSRNQRGCPPPEITIYHYHFLKQIKVLHFSAFQNEASEIRGQTKFLGKVGTTHLPGTDSWACPLGRPMNPSPIKASWNRLPKNWLPAVS